MIIISTQIQVVQKTCAKMLTGPELPIFVYGLLGTRISWLISARWVFLSHTPTWLIPSGKSPWWVTPWWIRPHFKYQIKQRLAVSSYSKQIKSKGSLCGRKHLRREWNNQNVFVPKILRRKILHFKTITFTLVVPLQ